MTGETFQLFGFEGAITENAPVHWAVAAIADGELVVNPATGATITLMRAKELIAERQLTGFRKPMTVPGPAILDAPSIVYSVRKKNDTITTLFRVDTGKADGSVPTSHRGGRFFYYFRTRKQFDAFRREKVNQVIRFLLYGHFMEASTLPSEVLSAGMALHAAHPELLALRTHFAPAEDRERMRRLALALLHDDIAVAHFEKMYHAATSRSVYKVKYKGGLAEGGGFDVQDARKLLRAYESVDERLKPGLLEEHPYLKPEVPSMRFSGLVAASAELTFSSALENESLGIRVARYLQLDRVQAALNGDYAPSLTGDGKFESALEFVTKPTAETHAQHKELESETPHPVVADVRNVHADIVQEVEVSVLGFLNGIFDDSRRVEFAIGYWKSQLLCWSFSVSDDGRGRKPIGLDVLDKKNDFLYRPCVLRALLKRDSHGRERRYLRAVAFVEEGADVQFDSYPSTVVHGALIRGGQVTPRIVDQRALKLPFVELANIDSPTSPHVRRWCREFHEALNRYELTLAELPTATWLVPSLPPAPTELDRVVVAMGRLGDASSISQVVEVVNQRFDVFVRINNTRRTVLKNELYLRFSDAERTLVELTDDGHRYYRAYSKAGGAMGSDE